MNQKYLTYKETRAYVLYAKLAPIVWRVSVSWDWFNKRTLGSQWVDAVDSIGANIAEGFGRYHKKDKEKFFYNARGSAIESQHWSDIAFSRGLVHESLNTTITYLLQQIPREINFLIYITEQKLSH